MSGVVIAATVIGTAVRFYSGIQQAEAAQDAADAQKEANKANQAAASAQAAQERIKQARAARIAAAQAEQAGANGGMGAGSSIISGAVGSASSQMASNIGQINVQESFAEQASIWNQKAADAMSSAAQWQSIGNFAQGVASWGASRAFKTPGTLWGGDGKIQTVGGG